MLDVLVSTWEGMIVKQVLLKYQLLMLHRRPARCVQGHCQVSTADSALGSCIISS